MQQLAIQQNLQMEMTPLNMYNMFIERIRRNLHVVLAFSPIGDNFRNRIRMFPSLINCCTIDWFKVTISFNGFLLLYIRLTWLKEVEMYIKRNNYILLIINVKRNREGATIALPSLLSIQKIFCGWFYHPFPCFIFKCKRMGKEANS